MSLRLPRPVDRRAAYVRTQTPEAFEAIRLDAETGAYVALLREAPADPAQLPIVVTVNGAPRTRVTSMPAAGEFRIWTTQVGASTEWLPVLEFHASDAGLLGVADYYRGGTRITRLWMEELFYFRKPLFYANLAALQAAAPPTLDEYSRGHPNDLAIVAGALYYSNGVDWQLLSGGSPVGAGAGLGPATAPVIVPGITGKGGAAASLPGASAGAPTAQPLQVDIGAAPGSVTASIPPATAPASAQPLSASGAAAVGAPVASAPATAQVLGAVGNAPGSVFDDFTGANGSAPNAAKWSAVTGVFIPNFSSATIQSNALQISSSGFDDGEGWIATMCGRYSTWFAGTSHTIDVSFVSSDVGANAEIHILGEDYGPGAGGGFTRNAVTIVFLGSGAQLNVNRYNSSGVYATLLADTARPGSLPAAVQVVLTATDVTVTVNGTQMFSGAHGINVGTKIKVGLARFSGTSGLSSCVFDAVSVS